MPGGPSRCPNRLSTSMSVVCARPARGCLSGGAAQAGAGGSCGARRSAELRRRAEVGRRGWRDPVLVDADERVAGDDLPAALGDPAPHAARQRLSAGRRAERRGPPQAPVCAPSRAARRAAGGPRTHPFAMSPVITALPGRSTWSSTPTPASWLAPLRWLPPGQIRAWEWPHLLSRATQRSAGSEKPCPMLTAAVRVFGLCAGATVQTGQPASTLTWLSGLSGSATAKISRERGGAHRESRRSEHAVRANRDQRTRRTSASMNTPTGVRMAPAPAPLDRPLFVAVQVLAPRVSVQRARPPGPRAPRTPRRRACPDPTRSSTRLRSRPTWREASRRGTRSCSPPRAPAWCTGALPAGGRLSPRAPRSAPCRAAPPRRAARASLTC